jgi:tetratricopeptide (TPR) repeat protein
MSKPAEEPPERLSRKELERFENSKPPRYFICLSGLERLCDRTGNAYNSAHRAFFRMLTDEEFKDVPIDLVLISGDPDHPIRYLSEKIEGTNSLKPWTRLPCLPMAERFWVMTLDGRRHIDADELKPAPILAKLLEQSVALDTWVSLCANERFKEGDSAEKQNWISQLESAAGRNRLFEVLSEIFQTYRHIDEEKDKLQPANPTKRPSTSELRELILHHLSLFSLPIQASALVVCPEIRRVLTLFQQSVEKPSGDKSDEASPQFDEEQAITALLTHLGELHRRGLVIRVAPARSSGQVRKSELRRQDRYTLHSQMRQYLAKQMRFALPDRGERNYYGVSLYTVQPRDLPTPSEVHFRRVYRIVEELLNAARQTLRPFYSQDNIEDYIKEKHLASPRIHEITHRLRAAYSILRESFSIGSLSRLKRFEGNPADPGEPYEIYRGLLGALIGAAVSMSCWDTDEIAKAVSGTDKPKMLRDFVKGSAFGIAHPFYRQEILWLINERGLTAFVQGRLYDAIPLFNQALRIARQVSAGEDNDTSFRATERRITLNLAVAQIERGNIRTAWQLLETLAQHEPRTKDSTPSITKELAEGYLGLCDHLSGHLKRAEMRYSKVLEHAQRIESMRSLAIFHRHYADLLRLLNRTDEAQKHLRLAMLAAARDEQKDVFQHALIAQARLHRDIGGREAVREASRQLDEAERYARELGLIKLEIEALKVRSTIILAQGETEQAGRLAARAVGLANRHGMELHKISASITHGRILLERGQTDLAHSVLRQCESEADRRCYQLAAISAGRLLRNSVQPLDADELGTIWVKDDVTR